MFGILALLFIAGIPAFIAYLIGLFTYKRLVKRGNTRPRRIRNIVVVISYIVLLGAELLWLFFIVSNFER